MRLVFDILFRYICVALVVIPRTRACVHTVMGCMDPPLFRIVYVFDNDDYSAQIMMYNHELDKFVDACRPNVTWTQPIHPCNRTHPAIVTENDSFPWYDTFMTVTIHRYTWNSFEKERYCRKYAMDIDIYNEMVVNPMVTKRVYGRWTTWYHEA
jgi:hypothetical protein